MAEDPNKNPASKTPERGFGAPRVEKAPGIAEIELESNTERVRAAMAERRTTVQNQSETLKTSLENRVANLPEEVKNEATEILTEAQEEINQNEAELSATQEAANNEIENSWFSYGEKMGGGGPFTEEARPTFSPEKVEVGQASSEQPTPKEQSVETEEDKQELEMAARIGILERVLKQRGLSPEKRLAYKKELDELETAWQAKQGTGAESVTKVLPAKKEIPQETLELKEKIDHLTEEIDKRGVRQAMYYGPQGYEWQILGDAKINPKNKKDVDTLFKKENANFGVVQKEYPSAKAQESLAYLLSAIDPKKHKLADYLLNTPIGDGEQNAYLLSMARTVEEAGHRSNTVRINAVIPQELAGDLEDLLEENPKVVQALLLKLLPADLPKGQMAELKKSPKYISRFRPKQGVEEPPQSTPAATATPRAARTTNTPSNISPPPDAPPRTLDVRPAVPASAEMPKSREQLVAERRQLQREWEKEATKQTERQMGKEEQKKYQQLLRETGEKKQKMKPEERQKLIGDVGFTAEDYNLMKAGSKPWTLNAIWKRLGELDREIAEAPSDVSAPVMPSPPPEAPRGNPSRAVTGSFETRPAAPAAAEDEITINEDAFKAQELADAARVLNGVLAKMDQYFKSSDTETLEKISKDHAMAKTIIEQGTAALDQWQGASVESVAAAMAPEYGTAEDIAKLSSEDLEAIRQHFIDNLIASIRLAEHVPGTKRTAVKVEKTQEKKEKADAMMSEISHAIKFDDAWYRDNEEETLKKWEEARNGVEIKALLKEKLWPVADDMKLLKNADLDLIQEEVVEYLIPIVEAVKASKPPEAPSIGFAEKVKKHRGETLKKEINEAMKKRIELRQAVRRGEKGAENKLRKISTKLGKLRAERREMKTEK